MLCLAADFEIQIEDNGRGFDVAAQQDHAGKAASSTDGLRNMQQRLESIGGICRWESIPGWSTKIWFVLPLNPARNGKVSG